MKPADIALIIILGFFSCKAQKNPDTASAKKDSVVTTTMSLPDKPAPVADSSDIYRMTVLFYSIGSGTDYKSITGFEDWIGDYSAKSGKNILYEKTAWGREGETDFCLKLTELSAAGQTAFITAAKDHLKEAKWVNVYENQPCRHKARR